MDKYEMTMAEMIEVAEIETIINRERQNCVTGDCNDCKYFGRHNCSSTKKAEAIHNEGYRKVAEDEIVIKKSEYEELTKTYAAINDEAYYCGFSAGVEEAKQETRDILQELYDEAMRYTNEVVELSTLQIKQLAKEKGIELEKDNGQRRNI